MANKRILWIIGGGILFVGFILYLGIMQLASHNTLKSSTSIQYTSPISGQRNTDITAEAFDQAPDAFVRTNVSIEGYDNVYNYLTSEQASNAQAIINDFLMARSGLNDVNASIQSGSIVQNGVQVGFTIVVVRPNATYHVEISAANQFQTTPLVTIRRVD